MTISDSESTQESIMVGRMSIRYLIDGTATGGMGVFELIVPPNSNVPPPHSHTGNEECAYVLEGTLRYSVDGVERDLRAGEWMFTPRGSVHQFSNPHSESARALIVLTPDIGAQYFRDVASIVNAGGPPDRAKLLGLMSKYGLVPAPQGAAAQQGAPADGPATPAPR
ncbi:MAG: cupin domain-containing protein [Nitrospirae bacterium]|nr:cupin domain-containing protein [Nitrospirota bacterium]MDE3042972.1 cupin domain-containing protein [Nitrospirota bacterium]